MVQKRMLYPVQGSMLSRPEVRISKWGRLNRQPVLRQFQLKENTQCNKAFYLRLSLCRNHKRSRCECKRARCRKFHRRRNTNRNSNKSLKTAVRSPNMDNYATHELKLAEMKKIQVSMVAKCDFTNDFTLRRICTMKYTWWSAVLHLHSRIDAEITFTGHGCLISPALYQSRAFYLLMV